MHPVLTYPRSALVGSVDLGKQASFLASFGMRPRRITPVPAHVAAALYGLDAPTRQLEMVTPGSDRTVLIVETPHEAPPFAPLTAGPYALDFFTTDPATTMAMATAAGAHNITDYVEFGLEPSKHPDAASTPKSYENLFQGPDELTIYTTDINRTVNHYPNLLDEKPELINSELIEICWVVEDMDSEQAFWEKEVGVEVVFQCFAENAGMVELMYHPRPTLLRCINITDSSRTNTKIEFMSYPDETLATPPTWPLRGGLFASVFWTPALAPAIDALPSASFGEVVEFADAQGRPVHAVSALSPGNVRFEIRSRVAS